MIYCGSEPRNGQHQTQRVIPQLPTFASPFKGNVTNYRPKIHFPLVLLSVPRDKNARGRRQYPKTAGRMIPEGGLYGPFCPAGIPLGRCKNNGPSHFVTLKKDLAGMFLQTSHALPEKHPPPSEIRCRRVLDIRLIYES